jgi:hypothetical protein
MRLRRIVLGGTAGGQGDGHSQRRCQGEQAGTATEVSKFRRLRVHAA